MRSLFCAVVACIQNSTAEQDPVRAVITSFKTSIICRIRTYEAG